MECDNGVVGVRGSGVLVITPSLHIVLHTTFLYVKRIRQKFRAGDARFAIVASQYNARYVGCDAAGGKSGTGGRWAPKRCRWCACRALTRFRSWPRDSPGRLPLTHPRITHHASRLSAIICLGVILRGETVHAAHIGEAVSRALMEIQVQHEVPVIHEVLLLENEEQARARCLDPKRNRGREAAQTALSDGAGDERFASNGLVVHKELYQFIPEGRLR